jgi:hypothetical protein
MVARCYDKIDRAEVNHDLSQVSVRLLGLSRLYWHCIDFSLAMKSRYSAPNKAVDSRQVVSSGGSSLGKYRPRRKP